MATKPTQPKPYSEGLYDAYRTAARAGSLAYHTAEGVVRVTDHAVKVTDRAIRKNYVQGLTEEQVEKIRALYEKGDVRKDGTLDKVELRVALHKLTHHWLTARQMNEVWMEVDRDQSGTISFDEFLLHVGPMLYPPATYTIMRKAAERATQVRDAASKQIEETTAAAMEASLDLVWPQIEEAVSVGIVDQDMPRVMQLSVTKLLESVMRDLKIEVKEIASKTLRAIPQPPVMHNYINPVYRLLRRARGWFLYTLFPYDRTVWVQLRNPAFVVLKTLSLLPIFGIQPSFFILQFLLMEHWDEYQLVHFILLFKGERVGTGSGAHTRKQRASTHAPSARASTRKHARARAGHGARARRRGVAASGAARRGACLRALRDATRGAARGRDAHAPLRRAQRDARARALARPGSQFFSIGLLQLTVGAALYFAYGGSTSFFPWPRADDYRTYLFASQIFVVWVAFILLPYSKEKGRKHKVVETRTREAGHDDTLPIGTCCGFDVYEKRGGRLRVFLVYDTIVFCFCLALTLAVAYGTRVGPVGSLAWRQRMDETVYWTKTIYGLMSFPFMFFMVPLLGSLFTHTLPSGYTPYGKCVPVLDSQLMARKAEERRTEREMRHAERYLRGSPVKNAAVAVGMGGAARAAGDVMPANLDFQKQLAKEEREKEDKVRKLQERRDKEKREQARKAEQRRKLQETKNKAEETKRMAQEKAAQLQQQAASMAGGKPGSAEKPDPSAKV